MATADLQAVNALRLALEEAENCGDPEPIVARLAPDAVLMVPTFPVSDGRDACAAFLRETLPALLEHFDRRITYVSSEVCVMGDVAVDRGTFSFTIRPRAGGDGNVERGKYLYVLAKDPDDGWRLSRAIVTLDEQDDRRPLLRHFLAALAYRTNKALNEAPAGFGNFLVAPGMRTPAEIVRHMTGVLGAARAAFIGLREPADPLPTLEAETARFRERLEALSRDLASDAELSEDTSMEQLLQGPLADAMTHAGQLAMLRRLAGSPISAENFMRADIKA
jgi:ketosteroid isomerase-like protein